MVLDTGLQTFSLYGCEIIKKNKQTKKHFPWSLEK